MLQVILSMCLFAGITGTGQARDVLSSDLQKQTISVSVDTSILQALINFGSQTRIPIGIVLETEKPHQMCEENLQVTIRDRPMSEFLDALLARSNYAWFVKDGVIVIRPAHVPDKINRVLNMKFDKFGGEPGMTMQGSGIILSAWIYGRLHPEVGGYGGDILSSADAETFPDFVVRDASVEQILDKIASLGSKGMWFLQMRQDQQHKEDINLHTYSYKDDVFGLSTICSDISSKSK